jgi:hypothetical protein
MRKPQSARQGDGRLFSTAVWPSLSFAEAPAVMFLVFIGDIMTWIGKIA